MRFHHPLMRSAAYRAADLTDRRTVHRALADVLDADTDPDRRAWHAAQAAAGPDDAVAEQLENSAARAQSRGGIAAAATFLERATALTADPGLRGARAIAAAQAKRDAAAPAAAHELLAVAELGPLSDLQRAKVARLRAQMEFVHSRVGEFGAPPVGDTAAPLLDAAGRLEGVDDYSSREGYLEGIAALMYAGCFAAPGALAQAASAARTALAGVAELPRPVDHLLHGIVEWVTGGISAGAAPLRRALGLMCEQATSRHPAIARWLVVPGFPILQESAAHELWDDALALTLSTAAVQYARDTGALFGLPRALAYRAGAHVLAGEFATAEQLLEESASIIAATDRHAPMRYHAVMLAAWRGDPEHAGPLIDTAAAEARSRGEGRLLSLSGYATAVLHNGLGRYDEAHTAAREVCRHPDPGFHGWCLFELVEAATHTGNADSAAWALARLAEGTTAAGTDWGLGVLAAARGLLAADDDADALFGEAVERLGRTDVAVFRARAHLLYGERLRRTNRRTDARRHLTEAHELFTRMGAKAFADRTRRELIATGEKVRAPQTRTGDLTAQEGQIARLAAEGLTNQEIGAQLFISTHTVEWHLRKVFAKLGITSRRQLRTTAPTG